MGPSPRPKPALRVELLFYLTFLVAFALLVGVATSLLALAIAPDRGVAIIVASSEISELLRLASRIYVLRSGRIAAEVETTSTTEEEVLKLMAG